LKTKKVTPAEQIEVREKALALSGGESDYCFDFNLSIDNSFSYGACIIVTEKSIWFREVKPKP
jgi:hypothetical protein